MTVEERIARMFNLTKENWMKHANPWSVWTRYSALILIMAAFWSRIWIGWWSVIPIVLSLAWMYLNPVLFPVPRSTKNWASKAVFGEMVWKNRNKVPVPQYHKTAPGILNAISFAGVIFSVWGIIAISIWPAVLGIALVLVGKSWYLDRMVWLYEDMKHLPEYNRWLY